MKRFCFLLKQSWKIILENKKKFFWISLEMAIAIALSSILLTLAYSTHLEKKNFQTSAVNNNIKVFSTADKNTPFCVPYTPDDLEDLEKIFKDHGEVLLICDRLLGCFTPDKKVFNLYIRFTNALSENKYYCNEEVELVITNEENLWGITDQEKFILELRKLLNEELEKVTFVLDEFMERHLVEYYSQEIEPEGLLLLPMDLYFRLNQPFEGDAEYLNIFFTNEDYYSEGVIEAAKLLEKRHGKQFHFNYVSSTAEFLRQISELSLLIIGLLVMTGGVLIVIIMGLWGVVTSILKKRMKDISICLCLGVQTQLIYLEVLLIILTPSFLGGVIGIGTSSLIINNLKFKIFEITPSIWIYMSSFGIAFLVSLLAGIASLLQLNKIKPLVILREEN
ncbi:MAG: ABC transporter permease [Halanaerobiales bacterium]|nr:ABC transporter permease [Halanaerobiales bacterium]